jgi:hypothetical protein
MFNSNIYGHCEERWVDLEIGLEKYIILLHGHYVLAALVHGDMSIFHVRIYPIIICDLYICISFICSIMYMLIPLLSLHQVPRWPIAVDYSNLEHIV